MKSSFVTTAITRNLGLSLGIGLSLGLGMLGLSTYSSSQASSTIGKSVAQLTNTPTPQQESPVSSLKSPSPLSPVDARTVANEDIEQTITQMIPGLATCPYAQSSHQAPHSSTHPSTLDASDTMEEHRYIYHPVDLNGDRQDELIVHIMGPITCGTGGCTTLILQESPDRSTSTYDVVTQMSVVNFPVMVSDRTSSGWNDLLVMVSGGGTQPGYRHLKFDGQSYPTNPSLDPMVLNKEWPNGQVLIVSEAGRASAPIITATDCHF